MDNSKRNFLKTAAYIAPVIVSFSVAPAIAGVGSNATPSQPKKHAVKKVHPGFFRRRGKKTHKFYAKKKRFSRMRRYK